MNTSYVSLLPIIIIIFMYMEFVKNSENNEALTTPVNHSLHAYSFESKAPPNKEPICTSATDE